MLHTDGYVESIVGYSFHQQPTTPTTEISDSLANQCVVSPFTSHIHKLKQDGKRSRQPKPVRDELLVRLIMTFIKCQQKPIRVEPLWVSGVNCIKPSGTNWDTAQKPNRRLGFIKSFSSKYRGVSLHKPP